jgi:hypothetical protein
MKIMESDGGNRWITLEDFQDLNICGVAECLEVEGGVRLERSFAIRGDFGGRPVANESGFVGEFLRGKLIHNPSGR